MVLCLLVVNSTWHIYWHCDLAFFRVAVCVWLCLFRVRVCFEQTLPFHLRWISSHSEVRSMLLKLASYFPAPCEWLPPNTMLFVLLFSYVPHPFPQGLNRVHIARMVIEIEVADQVKQTNWREPSTLNTKQCALTECQFCLAISDKLSIRETIIAIIPIIGSKT